MLPGTPSSFPAGDWMLRRVPNTVLNDGAQHDRQEHGALAAEDHHATAGPIPRGLVSLQLEGKPIARSGHAGELLYAAGAVRRVGRHDAALTCGLLAHVPANA